MRQHQWQCECSEGHSSQQHGVGAQLIDDVVANDEAELRLGCNDEHAGAQAFLHHDMHHALTWEHCTVPHPDFDAVTVAHHWLLGKSCKCLRIDHGDGGASVKQGNVCNAGDGDEDKQQWAHFDCRASGKLQGISGGDGKCGGGEV